MKAARGSSRQKNYIFIIGSPRSGTTWLHSILADHPSVASIAPVELTHFANYLPALVDRWELQKKNISKGLTQGLPVIWSDEEFREFLADFTDRVYDKVLERNPAATHIVDKHPNYSNHTGLIRQFYPNAKFIHVLRDGRDVAISSKSAHERLDFMHDDVGEMARKWVRFIGNARKADDGAGNYLEVKYEDMLADGMANLSRIFHFAGLAISDENLAGLLDKHSMEKNPVSGANTGINKIRHDKKRLYNEKLTLEERYVFDVIAGKLMKNLGYAAGNEWIFSDSSDRMKLLMIKAKYKFHK